MYLQLYQIKKHLNIDDDFRDDDEYLMDLASVAENIVQIHIDRQLSDLEADDGSIPQPLIQAMLLFIGNMYVKREGIVFGSASEVPQSYGYLLDLFRNYNGKETEPTRI